MFGLFKKKKQEEVETDADMPLPPVNASQPVVIPPARDRVFLSDTQLSQTDELAQSTQTEPRNFFTTRDESSAQQIFQNNPVTSTSHLPPKTHNLPTATAPLPKIDLTIRPLPSKAPPSQNPPPARPQQSSELTTEQVAVPISMIIKALPPQTLSVNPALMLGSADIGNMKIFLPRSRITSQLHTGVVEFSIGEIAHQIPAQIFRPGSDGLLVRLPASEIQSLLSQVNSLSGTNSLPKVTNVQGRPVVPLHELINKRSTAFPSAQSTNPPSGHETVVQPTISPLPPSKQPANAPPPGLSFPKTPSLSQIAAPVEPPAHTPPPSVGPSSKPPTSSSWYSSENTTRRAPLPTPIMLAESLKPSSPHHPGEQTQPKPSTLPTSQQPQTSSSNIPPTAQTSTSPPHHTTQPKAPTISLAPSGNKKPPAIGGPSRIGQTGGLTGRESLAAIANLAAESAGEPNQNSLENGEEHFTKIFKRTVEEAARGATTQVAYQQYSSQSSPSEHKPDTQQNQPESGGQIPAPFPSGTNQQTVFLNPTTELNKPHTTSTPAAAPIKETPPTEDDTHQSALRPGLVRPISKPSLFKTEKSQPPLQPVSLPKPPPFRVRPLETSRPASSLPSAALTTQEASASSPTSMSEEEPIVTRPASKARENLARTTLPVPTATSTVTASRASQQATKKLQLTFSLARWLGLESDDPVPIESVPALLTNSPYIKGAAVVDTDGLTLAAHLPQGLAENAIGKLAIQLYQQARSAAQQVGSSFEGQCVVSLGRWTLQITHQEPFYLVTFHDGLDFPPALARRLRKVAHALVRQETLP